MANSERLRLNKNQHVVKNLLSKGDDKKVVEAMMHVIEYMNTRFPLKDMGYRLDYVDRITLRELIDIISSYETRFEFSALTNEGSFIRSEEHTSELQSLMRISYAVFCLKKKNSKHTSIDIHSIHS